MCAPVHYHAVVSAPTGSGKTLIGETAILTALAQGWAVQVHPRLTRG